MEIREIEVGGGVGVNQEASNTAVKRRVCARGSILAGPSPFSCEKHEKHEKQPLSRKISERKLKRASLYVEGIKEGKEKTRQFSNTKLIQVRVSF